MNRQTAPAMNPNIQAVYPARPTNSQRNQQLRIRRRKAKRRKLLIKLSLILIFSIYCLNLLLTYLTTGSIFQKKLDSATLHSLPEWLQELVQTNAETTDFALNYKNRDSYIGKPIDLTGDYTAGKVPSFYQWDKRWGYDSYDASPIATAGCGPTCLSMAYVYFTADMDGNPRYMADFASEHNFHTSDGTSWALWTEGVAKLGLNGSELPLSKASMESALDESALIVCSMRPGDFTTTGHYILLRDYDKNGFYVNDPNSKANSKKQWSYDTLEGQIKNLWAIRTP